MSVTTFRALGLLVLLIAPAAHAQPAQPAPGRGQGGFRVAGGVGFNGKNAADQLAAIRGLMDVTDDEWKAMSPQVEKVIKAKQEMSTGAGMIWSSSNNAKPTFQASTTKVETAAGRAMQDVRDAAADEAAPKEQLVAKIAAARKAKLKARADYEAAQQELADAVTPRQLALLMTLGVVE